MEKLGNSTKMTAEIAFCPLWYAFTALNLWLADPLVWSIDHAYPSNQDILRQR